MIHSGVGAGEGTVHDVLFRNTHFGVSNGTSRVDRSSAS